MPCKVSSAIKTRKYAIRRMLLSTVMLILRMASPLNQD